MGHEINDLLGQIKQYPFTYEGENAWRQLDDHIQKRIKPYLYNRTHNWEHVEEIYCEVLHAVCVKVKGFLNGKQPDERVFFGWLKTIARHKVSDFYRYKERRPQHHHINRAGDGAGIPCPVPSAERKLENEDTLKRIWDWGEENLSKKEWAVVSRMWCKMDWEKIANDLGITVRVAQKTASRGLGKIRKRGREWFG